MTFTRLFFKLAIISALIFAALIALIRSQPYDDSQLRAFLTPPEGCPAPCFMGIRPGVTTMEEALAILEGHEWVAEIVDLNNRNSAGKMNSVSWHWTMDRPRFILLASTGNLIAEPERDVVEFIHLTTTIPLADIELLWGTPNEYWYTTVAGLTPTPVYLPFLFNYWSEGYSIRGLAPCPYRPQLRQVMVGLTVGYHAETVAFSGPFLRYSDFLSVVTSLQNHVC
jgi:hypothetical protein